MTDLPKWKCDKIVQAGKITGMHFPPEGPTMVFTASSVLLTPKNFARMVGMTKSVGDNEAPWTNLVGGYYVRYEDGYESWSPAKAFEEGYTRIDAVPDAPSEIKGKLMAASANGLKRVSIEIEPGLRQIWIAGETVPE